MNRWEIILVIQREVKKVNTDQIITLLSGAGLGSILSAILVFVNNSKKNQLDYITKERAEWRKSIKLIIVDLLDGKIGNLQLVDLNHKSTHMALT